MEIIYGLLGIAIALESFAIFKLILRVESLENQLERHSHYVDGMTGLAENHQHVVVGYAEPIEEAAGGGDTIQS